MIRVHKPTGTVVCQATNPKNLHSRYGEQLGLSGDYEDRDADFKGRVGDLADGTPKPENYPKPSAAEVLAAKVAGYRQKAQLQQARALALAAQDSEAVAEIDAQIAAL